MTNLVPMVSNSGEIEEKRDSMGTTAARVWWTPSTRGQREGKSSTVKSICFKCQKIYEVYHVRL